MNESRRKILQMLENGKLTADEAAALIEAIGAKPTLSTLSATAPAQRNKAHPKRSPQRAPQLRVDKFNLGEWLKQLLGVVAKSSHVETFEWTHDPTGIQQIAMESSNGAIECTGDNSSQFTVHAEKIVRDILAKGIGNWREAVVVVLASPSVPLPGEREEGE